ncbi:lipid-A-disaccharide synthase [Tropicimonas sp. S265A]|uniref:lipid-A-disaccharide synthase n=1 Tax=Tropicimonas sp. S265A TaxID=3415134 RepID=UPI003C7A716F
MRVFVVAGEPSGDRLGGALMRGLKTLVPEVEFAGIGGPDMISEGLTSRFEMSELSVMGIAEVLPKYRHLMSRIDETATTIVAEKPDVLITIDSPDFCLRVARRVKAAADIRTVHYVAPTVWAWRPKRAAKMAKMIDEVLCLFPFEPPYMEAAGMKAHFVGHPVVAERTASDAEAAAFRNAQSIPADTPLILALPGSRRGEISRLAPIFGEVLAAVVRDKPAMRVIVPTVQHTHDLVADLTSEWPGAPILIPSDASADKAAGFAAANVALAASGTVSLELAASATPMVIAYDMNILSRWLIGALLKVDTVTLVNLVSDTRAIPEFLGKNCTASAIAPALLKLLTDAPARETQMNAMRRTMVLLGQGGEAPGLRAARAVLSGAQ